MCQHLSRSPFQVRSNARLKYLVHTLGIDDFRILTEQAISHPSHSPRKALAQPSHSPHTAPFEQVIQVEEIIISTNGPSKPTAEARTEISLDLW